MKTSKSVADFLAPGMPSDSSAILGSTRDRLSFCDFVKMIVDAREGKLVFAGSQPLLLAIHQRLLTTQMEAENIVTAGQKGQSLAENVKDAGRLRPRNRIKRDDKKKQRRKKGMGLFIKKGKGKHHTARKKMMAHSRSMPGYRKKDEAKFVTYSYDTITTTSEDIATVSSEEEGVGEEAEAKS